MKDSKATFSDYKIIRPLGSEHRRKFNAVYLCEHKTSGEKAVLKHLAKQDGNASIQEMLRFEASLAFESQHFPKTILLEETENELFLFKSYLEGIPLDVYWKQLKRKEREQFIIRLFQKLHRLFEELSAKKLIHGDIKPGNVLIEGAGLDFEAKLIDFGLSFHSDETIKRSIIFSLGYSAPELILNELDLANQSSDFFALGICIWQLFEGKLPLVHPNPAIMTNLQFTHPLPQGDAMSKAMNAVLCKMCYKEAFPKPPNMLSKEEIRMLLQRGVSQRFQSLTEALDAYRNFPKKRFSLRNLIKISSNS